MGTGLPRRPCTKPLPAGAEIITRQGDALRTLEGPRRQDQDGTADD